MDSICSGLDSPFYTQGNRFWYIADLVHARACFCSQANITGMARESSAENWRQVVAGKYDFIPSHLPTPKANNAIKKSPHFTGI
jgi:hypothetical protein